jgi:hypothetical protein
MVVEAVNEGARGCPQLAGGKLCLYFYYTEIPVPQLRQLKVFLCALRVFVVKKSIHEYPE